MRRWRTCGGSRGRCRSLLASTLAQAIKMPADQVYPGDGQCSAGDQWCWDAILQRPLGGITQPLFHGGFELQNIVHVRRLDEMDFHTELQRPLPRKIHTDKF